MATKVLTRPTLVLNRNWQPVRVATVARALAMLFREAARVVDPEDFQLYTWEDWAKLSPRDGEPFVQAVRFRLRLPEVIVLLHYDRVPITRVALTRRNLYRRDRFTCQYCGTRPGSEELTIDHVTPRSQGGTLSWENCVLACVACNRKKADRTPHESGMRLRRRPARPTWTPIYATDQVPIKSWSKFISEAYWNVALR